jgi:ABC-type oligopeptide transport system substrate-binding subunit
LLSTTASLRNNLRKAHQQNYLKRETIMKTIWRIITILLVAALVAGAFSLAVNNSSSTAMTSVNGQSFEPTDRHQGGTGDGGSIAGGLAGVLGTLAKLTGISILVLLIQNGFSQLGNRKLISTQR